MTPEEHHQLIQQERLGQVLIGVDRAAARKFFTDTDHASVQAAVGESLYLSRIVVKISFILSYFLLVLAVGAGVWAFRWWALAIVPLIIVLWSGYLAGSSLGNAGLGLALSAAAAAAVTYFLAPLSESTKVCFLLVAGALFFTRFTYTSSTFFLRALAIRNWKALATLEGNGLVVRQVAGGDPGIVESDR